jgi:hypothetical protein
MIFCDKIPLKFSHKKIQKNDFCSPCPNLTCIKLDPKILGENPLFFIYRFEKLYKVHERGHENECSHSIYRKTPDEIQDLKT